ncbi:MAG: fumarylacetoacetate hydrolase family protein, partial [Silvibacterium sp.]
IMIAAMSPIGGWKVGALAPDATPVFSAMPLWGGYAASGSRISSHFKRLRGVEAEIAFLLGKDLPPRAHPYTREEVAEAIASAHPAIELLESAYLDPDKVDRFSMIGDLQMNGGFVHGAAVPDWKSYNLTQESVTVTIDGMVRFEGKASNPAGTDLLRLVTWLANEGSYRTGGLHAGPWITTGSWSGKSPASAGSTVEVRFSSFGEVNLRFD